MSFNNIVKNGKKLKFNIKDIDVAFVNSIRRIILNEIPNIAFNFDLSNHGITDITINKNTSVLHNEFVSHRLSLIPICLDQDEIENFDPKKYKFVLKKKNNTQETVLVTTKDFEIFDENNKQYPNAFRERIFPKSEITNDYILITKLKANPYDISNGEEIDIECIASKNIAAVHSRWCPVSQCSYGNAIDNDAASKALKDKITQIESESQKHISDEQKKSIRQQFYTKEAYRHFIKNIYDEPSEFEFMIETECALNPIYLFGKAIEVLKNKVVDFIKSDNDIIQLPHSPNFFEIHIKNEDYTLINLLQSIIYNINFRQSSENNILDSISYYKVHPLDNIMVLKIKFINSINDKNMKEFLKSFLEKNCKIIIDMIDKYALEWSTINHL